jgi:acyl transferase domain-containing protein
VITPGATSSSPDLDNSAEDGNAVSGYNTPSTETSSKALDQVSARRQQESSHALLGVPSCVRATSPGEAQSASGSGSVSSGLPLSAAHSPMASFNTVETSIASMGENTERLVFPFSCGDKSAFAPLIQDIVAYLEGKTCNTPEFLQDFAYTLSARSSAFKLRTYFVDSSVRGLVQQLQGADADSLVNVPSGPANVCFVFGGQGAVWPEMGRGLLCFRPFEESLEAASSFMKNSLGSSFDLLTELLKPSSTTSIATPEISQPATTALQVALVDLLRAFNVMPKYVVGHSSGEIAAAYATSAITCEGAWTIAYYRGKYASEFPQKHPEVQGRMMVVGMSAEEVQAYIADFDDPVEVACINSPTLVTLSGDRGGIELIAADLVKKKKFHRVLDIPVAYHSRHMALIADEYKASLGHIVPREPCEQGPIMLSSVHARVVNHAELNEDYWVANLVGQVRFVDALRALESVNVDDRPRVFIELSPSNGMRGPVLDTIKSFYSSSHPAEYTWLMRREVQGAETLLGTLGKLWTAGVHVDLHQVAQK